MTQAFNMDCMEAMRQFTDKFFDLAIVDPPYGINAANMQMGSSPNRPKKNGSGPAISTAVKLKGRLNQGHGKLKNRILNNSSIEWDNSIPNDEYFQELFRVSKNQIIWGGNYFPLPPTRCVLCWDKRQPWENFSQWEMAWTSFDSPAALFSYSNTGCANAEPKIHPTQKPVALYRWLLKRYGGSPGGTILDTHLGSGSSRIAAHQMGFEFYGYELNTEYFEEQEKRFNLHASQLSIAL